MRRILQITSHPIFFLPVLAVVITLTFVFSTRESTVNRSNYNRILIGMSESEVDMLFPQSPVTLVPLDLQDVTYDESMDNLMKNYPPPHRPKSWEGDRYYISIILDKNGRVASKYYQRSSDASIIDRIADWLGI